MRRLTTRTLLVGAVVVAVVVGTGTAIAASGGARTSPSAFLDSLAKHLGISREKLDAAAKAAAIDQVDAALDAGTITKEQAAQLKERIESGQGLFFGGLGRGFGPGFRHEENWPGFRHEEDFLSVAADYLGLTEEDIRSRLEDGKTLAQIAKAEGKSVDGLEQALVAGTKKRLAEAVEDGRLTEEQAADLLTRYAEHVDALVAGTLGPRGGFRGRHGFGPPADLPFRMSPGSFGSLAPPAGVPA